MRDAYIVGIAGESAGGKSTLSDCLKAGLKDAKVKSFHLDQYFKEPSMRPVVKGYLNEKTYRDDNHPDTLDWDRFHADFQEARTEGWDVILVEGMFALWDEKLAPLLDLKVYVDCDPDERFARRVARNLSYGQELGEIMERYVQAVQPRQQEYVAPGKWKADIIVNGFRTDGGKTAGTDILLHWIRQNRKLQDGGLS